MAILSPSVLVNFSYGVLSAREINLTLFHDTLVSILLLVFTKTIGDSVLDNSGP